MATIPQTPLGGPGQRAVTETVLTGTADTFIYRPGAGQILLLRNATTAALSPIIDGADGSTVPVPGIGNVDVSAGYAVGSIPAGAVRAIPLDTISAYLEGPIAIKSATGLVATLLGK